jgi:phenylalanyl-tRNA synthetase alpha chain
MPPMLTEKLENLKTTAEKEITSVSDLDQLQQLKVRLFGKQGEFSALMRELATVPKEKKPEYGKLINELKVQVEEVYSRREHLLRKEGLARRLEKEKLDLTLPGPTIPEGSIHLIEQVIAEATQIMSRLGYSVRTGPMVETDFNNFEALNVPADHPARDMQDTFYVDADHVLRTHTSPIQIRTMLSEKPPLRIVAPGGTFRVDADSSHSPHFHQMELLMVDRKASLADLKGTVSYFVREFYGRNLKTRFRPSFFPFTEPSAEVDCQCPVCKGNGCGLCKHTGWVEIGGCGLVHPNVFRAVGLDPATWQGFAFGFGIERMAIIRYGVDDIKHFVENDLRFLGQFR